MALSLKIVFIFLNKMAQLHFFQVLELDLVQQFLLAIIIDIWLHGLQR
jgi:hypothetical protein